MNGWVWLPTFLAWTGCNLSSPPQLHQVTKAGHWGFEFRLNILPGPNGSRCYESNVVRKKKKTMNCNELRSSQSRHEDKSPKTWNFKKCPPANILLHAFQMVVLLWPLWQKCGINSGKVRWDIGLMTTLRARCWCEKPPEELPAVNAFISRHVLNRTWHPSNGLQGWPVISAKKRHWSQWRSMELEIQNQWGHESWQLAASMSHHAHIKRGWEPSFSSQASAASSINESLEKQNAKELFTTSQLDRLQQLGVLTEFDREAVFHQNKTEWNRMGCCPKIGWIPQLIALLSNSNEIINRSNPLKLRESNFQTKCASGNSRSPMCKPRPEKVDSSSSFRIIPRPQNDSRQLNSRSRPRLQKRPAMLWWLGASAVENPVGSHCRKIALTSVWSAWHWLCVKDKFKRFLYFKRHVWKLHKQSISYVSLLDLRCSKKSVYFFSNFCA